MIIGALLCFLAYLVVRHHLPGRVPLSLLHQPNSNPGEERRSFDWGCGDGCSVSDDSSPTMGIAASTSGLLGDGFDDLLRLRLRLLLLLLLRRSGPSSSFACWCVWTRRGWSVESTQWQIDSPNDGSSPLLSSPSRTMPPWIRNIIPGITSQGVPG